MKTHIIQLEQYDDTVSARDKMSWAKGERILLVWPERGRVLFRRMDLVLLQRQSAAQGAQLALVTRDPDVRYFAPRLGIPVFKSLRKAQRAVWRLPRRFRGVKPAVFTREIGQEGQPARSTPVRPERTNSEPKPVARLGFFAVGVLSLLAIAMTLVPSAVVTLTPKTGVQEVTLDVRADTGTTKVDLSGIVPARWVHVTVEGRDTTPASGTMLVPERPAQGEVLFTNLTDGAVVIPKGTVVLSPEDANQRFTVTQTGELPAGPGETISLPVSALSAGSQGNLPAGRLIAIEGLLGTQVSVINREETHSGSDRTEPTPNAADRSLLAGRLHGALEQTAIQELQKGLQPGSVLITSTLKLVDDLEEKFQPGEGQPADQLALNLQQEYQAQVVSATDIAVLAQAVFDANLPPGFVPVGGSLQVENIGLPANLATGQGQTENQLKWKMHATRQILAQAPTPEAIRLVLGYDPDAASRQLQSELALEEPPKIRLTPTWWPRLPILPFRIDVEIDFPGAGQKQTTNVGQPVGALPGF
jgi:Baseplate J-like protein